MSANEEDPVKAVEEQLKETTLDGNTISAEPSEMEGSSIPNVPEPRAASEATPIPSSLAGMTASSTALGTLNQARRPAGAPPITRAGSTPLNADFQKRMKAFHDARSGQATPQPNRGASLGPPGVASPGPTVPGFPPNLKLPFGVPRPGVHPANSTPASPAGGLAAKRGIQLGGFPGQAPAAKPGRAKPGLTLSSMGAGPGSAGQDRPQNKPASKLDEFSKYLDQEKGQIIFPGKATVHGDGIEFTTGKSFSISLDEVDTIDELGKGNYGTVYKVRHARPKFRRQGQGLAGNKARGTQATGLDDDFSPVSPQRANTSDAVQTPTSATTSQAHGKGGTTGIVMAMKEMRLELEDAKFQSIVMELDVLHRCISPFIVDFYGAFFQEGAVYICMEWMDGGSIDKLYGDGVPEPVLQRITYGTVMGLKYLKEEHNIIHRDVKPTNILVNTSGRVKVCDFGVSGNLVASIAKTNIGCQSYMAPERISSGGMAQAGAGVATYNAQSDIWSLALSIIESALGRYPYPPETYDNIFSQLSAIVDGQPPDLPADRFSVAARDFVAGCLNKIPKLRPTYPMLLQHAWLAPLVKPTTITEEDEEAAEAAAAEGKDIATPQDGTASGGADDGGFFDKIVGEWVIGALERRRNGTMGKSAKPALHAAPLDAVGSPKAGV